MRNAVKANFLKSSSFACLLLLDHRLVAISFPLRRAAAAAALAATLGCLLRRRTTSRAVRAAIGTLPILLLLASPTSTLALTSFALALATADMLTSRSDGGTGLPRGVAAACTWYVLSRVAFELWPGFATTTQYWLSLDVRLIERLWPGTARWAYSFSCGPVLLLLLMDIVAAGVPRQMARRIAILGATFTLCLAAEISIVRSTPADSLALSNLLAVVKVSAILFFSTAESIAMPSHADGRRRSGRGLAWRVGVPLCCVAAVSGLTLCGSSWMGPSRGHRIRVFNRGGLDWNRPVFGKFGAFSGGMFGLLPVYLRANGFDFDVIDRDRLDAESIRDAQVLVLINSAQAWSDVEKELVRRFVAAGGSLLVLGDHTDVFGLMKSSNDLIGRFGIQFRFDSAYHSRQGWRGCLAPCSAWMAAGWELENPGVAIGASLDLGGGSARPLLTGRFGHSDVGDRANVVGSFLGNYQYEKGEEVGDAVLAACANYGDGRVVAIGDTTPFQGGIGREFGQMVGPLLDWLCRPVSIDERPWFRVAVAALLIVLSTAAVATGIGPGWLLATDAALYAAIAATLALQAISSDYSLAVDQEAVIVDHSHWPSIGHYEARINPIGPFYSSMHRAGYRVTDLDEWSPRSLGRSRGLLLVAPQKPFTPSEVATVLRAEEGGCITTLVAGQPDAGPSRLLLEAHGLRLVPRPLGPVPSGTASGPEATAQPRFLDAWPIAPASGVDFGPGVEVVYQYGDEPLVVFARRGTGGLLLVSDTRFFSSMNVEDTWGFHIGNNAFIHDMLVKYFHADPERVRPIFPSPRMPD